MCRRREAECVPTPKCPTRVQRPVAFLRKPGRGRGARQRTAEDARGNVKRLGHTRCPILSRDHAHSGRAVTQARCDNIRTQLPAVVRLSRLGSRVRPGIGSLMGLDGGMGAQDRFPRNDNGMEDDWGGENTPEYRAQMAQFQADERRRESQDRYSNPSARPGKRVRPAWCAREPLPDSDELYTPHVNC